MTTLYELGLPSHTKSSYLYKSSLPKRRRWVKPLLVTLFFVLTIGGSSIYNAHSLTTDYIKKGLTKKEAKVSLLNKLQDQRLGKLDEIIGTQVLNYMYEKHEKSSPKTF